MSSPDGSLRGAAAVLLLITCACAPDRGVVRPPTLRPIAFPDLPGADADARQQLRRAYDALSPAGTGAAYAEMGKLFMAAELDEAAEPCFLNAIALAPEEPRWSYYLAHVYRRTDLTKAASYFERTLMLQPDNGAALWWLGAVYLDLGRPADAEVRFSRALALQPGALSAVYGLGRAALARNDYATAVAHLERVLAMNARATAAHYPLGLAYRGLGQRARAEAHLAQRTHMEILPLDPLMNELEGLLDSVTAHQDRGMRAAQAGNWTEAAAHFGKAVERSPDDVSARLDLSTALARTGDAGGALEHARAALRLAPDNPRARQIVATLSTASR